MDKIQQLQHKYTQMKELIDSYPELQRIIETCAGKSMKEVTTIISQHPNFFSDFTEHPRDTSMYIIKTGDGPASNIMMYKYDGYKLFPDNQLDVAQITKVLQVQQQRYNHELLSIQADLETGLERLKQYKTTVKRLEKLHTSFSSAFVEIFYEDFR